MPRAIIAIGLMLTMAGVAAGLLAAVRVDSGPGSESQTQPAGHAVTFWTERTERDPADYIAYTKLGKALARYARESGDNTAYARSQVALEAALRLHPENLEAAAMLADVLLAQHKFGEALTVAERVLAGDPTATAALATIGDAQLAIGNYDEGLAAYELLAEDATGPAVLSRLSYLADLHGETERALRLMREAEAQASAHGASERLAWYRSQVGDLLFKVGRYGEAGDWYKRALEAYPAYAFGLGGLARIEAAKGNYEQAIALYQEALTVRAEPPYHAALGDLYAHLGDEAAAQQEYEEARALSQYELARGIPHIHEFVMLHAGYGVATERSVDLALAQLEDRHDIYSYDAAAWALYHAGRPGEARPLIDQALRLGTEDPQLLYHAGMISLASGDETAARMLLQRALELSPRFSLRQSKDAEQALAQLSASPR